MSNEIKQSPKFRQFHKEELQILSLNDTIQEEIMETLKFIHGPDFCLKQPSDYSDKKSNLANKYTMGQSNLIIRGASDFSKVEDVTESELMRLKEFAILRLASYGFHRNHCLEALKYCDDNLEDALYLLYSKYFNTCDSFVKNVNETELLEQRNDEKSSLQSIYGAIFNEKVQDSTWIITLKLNYLIEMFHSRPVKEQPKREVSGNLKICRNYLASGYCKFGEKCRFVHKVNTPILEKNNHLYDFDFELEIRFPYNSKYPYEPPMILLKTNAVLPPLLNLHICRRLLDEARLLASDGICSVYTIIELLLNEAEILKHIETNISFMHPNTKLFVDVEKPMKIKRPSHYIKGLTNRDNQVVYTMNELREMNRTLSRKFHIHSTDMKYLKMLRLRKQLPAYSKMNDILETIQDFQVVIISGETGCGKSTQVPQYILDDWLLNYDNNSRHVEIVCTQPRRISAVGVAERVAFERLCKIGNIVGYQIRLESKMSTATRLTFCTTGILLKRLESQPTLPQITHIIVDEVHERSEQSDFLLLLLKEILPLRPDLKVILMSATMDAELFSAFFGGAPIISISGRTFPVEQYFLEDIYDTLDYTLEESSEYTRKVNIDFEFESNEALFTTNVNQLTVPNSHKDETLSFKELLSRYHSYTLKTCKNLFLNDFEVINNELIESLLMWIVLGDHEYPRQGTILIFLPGIAEITTLFDQFVVHSEFGNKRKYMIIPLHSMLSSEEQALIFSKPKDIRKIVLSTNIAETSVTIEDCVFVIDTGKMREKHFDSNRDMESLETVWTTKANALQRKGRAGRVMPGVCFHLYTSNKFSYSFLTQPIPEIHRIPLEQLILNIKMLEIFENLDIINVINKLIEPPKQERVDTAILRLQKIGALDKNQELTSLGHHLAALPVDSRIGKLLLYGAIFSCVDSALTMAACLSHKSPFVNPFKKRDLAEEKRKKFAVGNSDHITVLQAYKKWLEVHKKSKLAGKNYANENFLSYRTLLTIADIKYQFLEYLVDIGFVPINLNRQYRSGEDITLQITGSEFNSNGDNINVLGAILCGALYPNIVKVITPPRSFIKTLGGTIPKEHEAKDYKFVTSTETVFLHPSSINFTNKQFPSVYLVYQEKVKTSKIYFKDCTVVPLLSLILFSGYDLEITVNNGCSLILLEDGWIAFQVEEHQIAEMLKILKEELLSLLEKKINDPLLNINADSNGEQIINTIQNLINLK